MFLHTTQPTELLPVVMMMVEMQNCTFHLLLFLRCKVTIIIELANKTYKRLAQQANFFLSIVQPVQMIRLLTDFI